MRKYMVIFTDFSFADVLAWDISSAYEFAQDLYGKAIALIRKRNED